MKKFLALSLSALLTVTALSGCNSTETPKSGNDTAGSSQGTQSGKVTDVTFITWAGSTELAEMQAIADKVNADQGAKSGYKVKLMSTPADYYTKIQSMFAAKSSDVDLMWLSQEYTPTFAALNGIQDITELAKNDANIPLENMYEAAVEASSYNGKTYGVPWIVNPVMVYYNKDMTDAAGYTDADYEKWAKGDWTVEDFYNIAKSMTKDSDGNGEYDQWGSYIWNWPPLSQWLRSFGGGYVDKDSNVIVNSPESVEGWKYIIKMFRDDASALPSVGDSNNGMTSFFQTGKVGMILGGSSDGIELEKPTFNIGYAVVPQGIKGEHVTFPWIGVTSLSSFSKVQKDVLYQATSDMTVNFFGWKVASPIKGQETAYQKLNPRKANLPLDIMIKSLEVASPGNLVKYAEIGSKVWDGTDGMNGIQQQIQIATTQNDYKKALDAIDVQKAADVTKDAIEKIMR